MKKAISMVLAALMLCGCTTGPQKDPAIPEQISDAKPAAITFTQELNGSDWEEYCVIPASKPIFPERPEKQENEDWETYDARWKEYNEIFEEFRGTEPLKADLPNFASKTIPELLPEQGSENFIYSPVSLWSALGLLAECADGESQKQILDLAGVESVEELRSQVSEVWHRIYVENENSKTLLSNSLWTNNSAAGSFLSLIHLCRCRRIAVCRSRWSP